MRIDVDLDIREELWGILHLVDEHRRFVKLEEQGRVILCHIPLGEVVKRYIFSSDIFFLRKRAKHGRFACLSRPGQKDRGVRFAEFEDSGFHVSADVFHLSHHFSADFDSDYIIAEKYGPVNRTFGRF